jgi:hypothetical protein
MAHPNIDARAYRLGIFVGFAAFFMMEKTLRVLGGGEGHTHSPEGHGHRDRTSDESASSAIEPNSTTSGLRSRHNVNGESSDKHECQPEGEKGHVSGPSKLSAYLNLFGDFVHNMSVVPEIVPSNACWPTSTPVRMALRKMFWSFVTFWRSLTLSSWASMAASFYSSPLIGATTTLACFAHEIPHEIADYSILIRSGFTKRQAMQSQFLTAIGAFVSLLDWRTSRCLARPFVILIIARDSRIISSTNLHPFVSRLISWFWYHCLPFRRLGKPAIPPPMWEDVQLSLCRTFMGIAIHNLSASGHADDASLDLAAAVRQTATGLLGTTVQLADLVRAPKKCANEIKNALSRAGRLSPLLLVASCT